MGCHFLLQGIFPTQRSNPGLSHCRQILYHLSYQGSCQYRCQVFGLKLFPDKSPLLPHHPEILQTPTQIYYIYFQNCKTSPVYMVSKGHSQVLWAEFNTKWVPKSGCPWAAPSQWPHVVGPHLVTFSWGLPTGLAKVFEPNCSPRLFPSTLPSLSPSQKSDQCSCLRLLSASTVPFLFILPHRYFLQEIPCAFNPDLTPDSWRTWINTGHNLSFHSCLHISPEMTQAKFNHQTCYTHTHTHTHTLRIKGRKFPFSPVVRTWCFHCWGHRFKIQSLVRELRSWKLWSVAKTRGQNSLATRSALETWRCYIGEIGLWLNQTLRNHEYRRIIEKLNHGQLFLHLCLLLLAIIYLLKLVKK